MKLSELANDVLTKAKTISKEGKELSPMFFIVKDEDVGVMPLPHYGNDRDFHIALMKSVIEAKEADAFVFAIEAWFSTPAKGSLKDGPIDISNVPRPSKDPNRKEAIVIHGATRKGEEVCLFVEIKRKGKKVSFEETVNMASGEDGKHLMALMSNMFGNASVN